MRIFRALLRLLPIDFRIEHGREIEQVFRAQQAEARGGGFAAFARLWVEAFRDLMTTAPRQHATMLRQDVSYAWHTLRRTPAFSAAAIVTLAIGISASTTIFSIINAFLLRPLPVDRPAELVSIATAPDRHIELPHGVSYPDLQDYASMPEIFSGVVGYQTQSVWMNSDGRVDATLIDAITEDGFSVLGIRPAVGRLLAPVDAHRPVIVLLHAYWQSRFNGDPAIVGKAVRLNEQVFTVIGVTDPRFTGLESLFRVSGFVPITSVPQLRQADPSGPTFLETRDMHYMWVLGRLRPGISIDQARAALAVKAGQLAAAYPATNTNIMVHVVPETWARPVPQNGPWFHLIALMLTVLAALLLIITAANLANMLLARASTRGREIALRAALGARQGRIVRQLLTESLVLAVIGCVPGVLLAMAAASLVERGIMASAIDVPLKVDFGVDWRVLTATLAVAVVAGVLSGLAPAVHARRSDVNALLKTGGRVHHGSERGVLRRLLIVGQVAVSLVLLIMGGLFVKTLSSARTVDLGFRSDGVLLVKVDLPRSRYPEDRRFPYYREARDRVAALPGIRDAAWISGTPFSYDQDNVTLRPEDRPIDPGQEPMSFSVAAAPEYFRAAGVSIVAGRGFDDRDGPDAPRVVMVNETLARALWPQQDPLGRRVRLVESDQVAEVIGVVKDGKYVFLWEAPRNMLFESLAQHAPSSATLEAATAGSPNDVAASVQTAIRGMDPDVPIYGVMSMRDYLEFGNAFLIFRMGAITAGLFGVLGLLLASVGLYGVVAFDVGLRTHEIGVRMALGARRGVVLRQVVTRGALLALAGTVTGALLAAALAWNLRTMFFDVNPFDLVTYGRTVALLIAVCLIASVLPARRAAGSDPVAALRAD